MIEAIIRGSMQNRLLVLIAVALLTTWGWIAIHTLPLDAIPDLSDVQVIIRTTYPGQSPQIVENQITYPLTTTMLAVPGATDVRGYSFFGDSFVYVLFEDGTDIYWARSRVLEYLNQAASRLPNGVQPRLGPDASGVGWIYQYALVDRTGGHDLAQLRSLQDWFLKFELQTVPGVSEVATVGGMVRQYQVVVDPNRLRFYGLTLRQVNEAIRNANQDTGGSVLEKGEAEYMIRVRGYLRTLADMETIPLAVLGDQGTPLLLRDVAHISVGPQMRRGIAELDGEGEVTGGIVVMRHGENALKTIESVKAKIASLKAGLPTGVEIIEVYDRSALIHRAIDTLTTAVTEELIVVALVCVIFLFHLPSAFVAAISLPLGVLIAFIIMREQGINANIMSLGGIAIAIGTMVDASIVMVENAHKHLERWREENPSRHPTGEEHWQLMQTAALEVGPGLFGSLIVLTLSFMPVFTLQAQEGRLFGPLAYTKTYTMAAAAGLAVTLIPVLMGYFIRGKIPREESNPLSRLLIFLYRPLLHGVLAVPHLTLFIALLLVISTLLPIAGIAGLMMPLKAPAYLLQKLPGQSEHDSLPNQWLEIVNGWQHAVAQTWRHQFYDQPKIARLADGIGTEFMPELEEGDLLYMPTTLPGVSIGKAQELLQQTDRLIRTIPEVKTVFGKIGRAETATDPAPLEMIETTIQLKPSSQWRPGVTLDDIIAELDRTVKFPGLTDAWVQPIKTRIDMLATGIKTPVGIKISGPDLAVIEHIGQQVEKALQRVPGTASAYSERVVGGRYIDITPNRLEAARYGLSIADLNDFVFAALSGVDVTETVEGRERYPVNLRFPREWRDDLEKLRDLPLQTPTGAQIPLRQVADIAIVDGPPMIRSENARPNGWTFVDIRGVDVGTYVRQAQIAVNEQVIIPAGYSIDWAGQYEYMLRVQERLWQVVPFTLIIIFVTLYLTFGNTIESLIVMFTLPFALIGGCWLLWLLDYNLSVAVAVGFIALAGEAAGFGVIMLVYLDNVLKHRRASGQLNSRADLQAAIMEGAVMRVRPKAMTVITVTVGLLPLMWSTGTGAEVMRRIATPMLGGTITASLLSMFVIPAVYLLWQGYRLNRFN